MMVLMKNIIPIFESLVDDCTIINYPVSKGKGNAIKGFKFY